MDELLPLPTLATATEPPAKRRGRPPKFDADYLLTVAREVFLERGITATTLEVAQRAGVSEGLLFHRFGSKEALFSAAMRIDGPAIASMVLDAVSSLEELAPRPALEHLARRLLEIGRIAIPLLIMSWSNPEAASEAQLCAKRQTHEALVRRLVEFFDARITRIEPRPLDAEVAARTFLGAIHHYSMVRLMMPSPQTTISDKDYVEGLVGLFLPHLSSPSTASSC